LRLYPTKYRSLYARLVKACSSLDRYLPVLSSFYVIVAAKSAPVDAPH